MLNATNATGAYTSKLADFTAQSIVEIRFTDGEHGEAVAVYPQVSLTSAEASSGRVNYGGRLICTALFADGEELFRVQKGVEFTHHIDDDMFAPAQGLNCSLCCENTTVKREGSAFVVSVVVGAKLTVSDRTERNYISSLEGAETKREEGKLFSALAFSGESEVEDDFSIVATDVLVPSATPLVSQCTARAGLIEVSGDICLSLLAVRDGYPVSIDRVIPFKAELSCGQAAVASKAYCRAEIKDMSVDCKVMEERGKCDVTFSASLRLWGEVFEEESATLITDAFSTEKELELTYSEETAQICTDVKVYSEHVSGLCATKAKLDYTCAFLAAAIPRAEYSRTQDGIEGAVIATLLYSRNAEIHSTEVNLPFKVSLGGLENENCPVSVAVCGVSLRQRAEGECEGEASLKITAEDGKTHTVRYLSQAEECGDKKTEDCAISVYIPTCGDDLWQTAKKLNAPPESINKSNPELKFPLTGSERILVFRGKS